MSSLPWESLPGKWNLTVGLKASYDLAPSLGEPALSSQQDGLHEDVLFDHSPRASLYSPSDFVPFKVRADVLLVGQAHAPSGVPTDSLVVRLRVGESAKALRVTGDRAWVDTPQGPRVSAPHPFASAPLRYERATRKGENLAGATPGDLSRAPAAIDLVPEEGPAETPGFGPIATSWRASRDPRFKDVLIWSQRLRTAPDQGPPPVGADPTVFNSAPRDQQLADIHPGTPLVLEHLHPRFPRFEARIPTIVPRVFHLDAFSGAPREVPVRIDTLWIDTDREVFVISWRGFISTARPVEAAPGRVVVAAQTHGQTASFEEIDALVRGVATPSRTPTTRRPPPATVALDAVIEGLVAPFPIATPATTPAPNAAAPIAGAPWAGSPPARQASGTMAIPQFTGPAPAPAPFPLATPATSSAAAPSAPVEGAPWAGVPAAPVPRPNDPLGSTMPLGSSLADAMAKAQKLTASTASTAGAAAVIAPRPPSVAPPPAVPLAAPVETPPAVAARPPSVAPPSARPVWRVEEPPPAPTPQPAPRAPKPGPDARQELYGAFTRKNK